MARVAWAFWSAWLLVGICAAAVRYTPDGDPANCTDGLIKIYQCNA